MSNEFVMVPREWVEDAVKAGAGEVMVLSDIATLVECLSQQHPGEPVALPERQVFIVGETSLSHTEGWNACLDEIAKLGPLYTQSARVEGDPVASSVFNDKLYNAESDARNASALLEEVLEWFDDGCGRSPEEFKLLRKIGDWLGRSVSRIDGGGDECAHSYANKDGCPECGEAFTGEEPSAPECKYCGDTGHIMVGRSGDANDGNAPIIEPCEDCDGPSAPVKTMRQEMAELDGDSNNPYWPASSAEELAEFEVWRKAQKP